MNNQSIMLTKTTDIHPVKDEVYFQLEGEQDCLAVIIPFYNEEKEELMATLKSLYYCYKYLGKMKKEWANRSMKIVLIQDGWYKASDSMKEYLKELFPHEEEDTIWSDYYKEFSEYDINTNGSVTYIFEDENDICFNRSEVPAKETAKSLDITLIIKIDNRKKHNSHEWFMGNSGFAEAMKAKYLFCTDAFTMFHRTCLYHLIHHMDNNPETSVSTGRQRVMTREQQGTDEFTFSLSTLLRNVQLFDFESSNATYNGAFSLGGCLPVIPGPCGLYRASDILQDDVRYWYFDIVNQEPSQTGLVLGNLRIAEDRILSYSVVLKPEEERRMAFVPLALFYFEAELDLKMFLLQRRRWINGSVAGYIYLLFSNPEHILKWNTNALRKLYVWVLLMCQFITYCIVALGPSLSINILYYSLGYCLSFTDLLYSTVDQINVFATIGAWVLYAIHFYVHNKETFNYNIMYALLLFSLLTSILSVAASILYIKTNISINLLTYIIFSYNPLIYLVILVFALPFINAILISGRGHSFFYMIKSFIPYFLFSHMLISTFGSYSFARTWDLTWGNRPTTETTTTTEEELVLSKRIFKDKSIKGIIVIFCANLITFFLPTKLQLTITGAFFCMALIQIILSFLYLLFQLPNKLKYVYYNYENSHSMLDMVREDITNSNTLFNTSSNSTTSSIENINDIEEIDEEVCEDCDILLKIEEEPEEEPELGYNI